MMWQSIQRAALCIGSGTCTLWRAAAKAMLFAGPFLLAVTLLSNASGDDERARPNIVLIFIDDMGYGDLSCYGNTEIQTPNIDRLAEQGTRFTQFYVASPICSPSRVAITTGQYPARHKIHSYLASRKQNRDRGMADFLDSRAPTIARSFQQAGYATAHFGKWHMGGGRDVDDAPHPSAYGFDESLVSFEGLGDRVIFNERTFEQAKKIGQGKITLQPKHKLSENYVDRSIDFIRRSHEAGKPFYLHLWLNDVHDDHQPSDAQLAKFERFEATPYVQRLYAVMDEMDRQIGRLIDAIDEMKLADSTLIVLCSDNGPTAWPKYYKEGFDPPGSTGGLRGRKWSLYEGGIREPLIVRWKGKVPAAKTNNTTIVGSVDFFPTFCQLAGIEPPDVEFDGVDQSAVLLGADTPRSKPLLWEYGRSDIYLQPGKQSDRSPNMAIRDGRWKMLMNANGSRVELYDFDASDNETENVAGDHPQVATRLKRQILAYRDSIPDYPISTPDERR